MEVAVIVDYIQFLMDDLYLFQYAPACRPNYIIHHILIDNLQISPDGDVEIDCPPELVEIVSAKGVDDVRKGGAHVQQVDELIHPHLAFAVAPSVVLTDAGTCSLLQVEFVGQDQLLGQHVGELILAAPLQGEDDVGEGGGVDLAIQENAVEKDEDFEGLGHGVVRFQNYGELLEVEGVFEQFGQFFEFEADPALLLEVAGEGGVDLFVGFP